MGCFRRTERLLLPLALLGAASCGVPGDFGQEVPGGVRVWAHAGQQDERAVLEAQMGRFNRMHPGTPVVLTFLPEGSYNEQVQAAALAGDLPDVLELDGPYVATYAWQGRLQPLDELLDDTLVSAMLPSIVEQGTWRGRLWALGMYDSGLGIYARRSALEAVGVRVPAGPADAWSVDEVEQLMRRLAATDPDGAVLDVHLNYAGEWYTFGFTPVLHSAGAGLLDPDEQTATGTLDAPASARALERIQAWITGGLVDPNLDDAAFVSGRVQLSWSGHWDFGRYREAWGDDVVVVPLPDFGEGTRTGQGSWVWALARDARSREAALSWLRFLLSPRQVREMSAANGAVPARRSVALTSPLYGHDGPLRILFAQLEGGWSVPRPRTPAYPVVTSAFQEVFEAVRSGGDVPDALEDAARLIDREIADNHGYPTVEDGR